MNLANPWLLLLGLAVVIPLWAHLARLRPPREVPFAALELTRALLPRRRLPSPPSDRALLALRVAAVLLVSLAAAGPVCVRPSPLALADGLAVVLDDSASMRAPHDAPRFEVARRAALRALDEARGGRVVAALACAPEALARSPNEARALILAARPTSSGCAVTDAARSTLDALGGLGARRPALVVATDGTLGAPGAPGESLEALARARRASLTLPLGAPRPLANVGVTGAEYALDPSGARVEASVRCHDPSRARVTVRVLAGARVLSEAAVDCLQHADARVRLPLAAPPDVGEAVVSLDSGDVFPDDDQRALRLGPPPRPSVAVVSPSPSGGGAALAEALRAAGGCSVEARPPSALVAPLDADVVALVSLGHGGLPPEASAWLSRSGAGLLVVGAPPSALAPRLPVARAEPREREVSLDAPVTRHPALTPLGEGARGLLPVTATVWWSLTPRPGASVLWTAGGEPVLVTDTREGARSAALGVSLDEQGSDLALRPSWVALVSGLVSWLAEPRLATATRVSPTTWRLARPRGPAPGSVLAPDGRALPTREREGALWCSDAYDPGAYRLGRETAFTVGIDPGEGDLRPASLPRGATDPLRGSRAWPLGIGFAAVALALLAWEAWLRARAPSGAVSGSPGGRPPAEG